MTGARYHLRTPPHDHRPMIDRAAADHGNAVWLVARLLIGGVFVQSGLAKLMDLGAFVDLLQQQGVPFATALAPFAAVVEGLSGLAILLGVGTRYAALLLIVFVVLATLIAHRFWAVPIEQRDMQIINFAKNVAIVGGLLMVFVTGGGRFSLDRWIQRPKRINIAS